MYDILLLQMSINDFWIKNVELDFLIDLYFPRFFGSHIMGAIYLLTLLYLVYCLEVINHGKYLN